VVYIVTSLGFVRQSFDALVDGIENSIIQAHENLRPGSIFLNNGKDHILFSLDLYVYVAGMIFGTAILMRLLKLILQGNSWMLV